MSLLVEMKPEQMSFTFSPSTASESEAIQVVREFLGQWRDENVVAPCIVFHELLRNAIQYGNRNLPDGKVYCCLERLSGFHYRIDVEDEGMGFDYGKLNFSLPEDPRHLPRRGYLIVHALCDRLEFNGSGNRVSVYLSTQESKQIFGL